jgi:predicted RNase H-like nuclease
MLPMTHHGMRMLAALRSTGWAVAPMDSGSRDRTAIEVMPGATLNALRLPHKGYKKGRNRFELRRRILDGLAKNTRVSVAGLAELSETCMTIDDALDAVVAAFTGALWIAAPDAFRLPSDEERDLANMEGWMCVPAFLTPPA